LLAEKRLLLGLLLLGRCKLLQPCLLQLLARQLDCCLLLQGEHKKVYILVHKTHLFVDLVLLFEDATVLGELHPADVVKVDLFCNESAEGDLVDSVVLKPRIKGRACWLLSWVVVAREVRVSKRGLGGKTLLRAPREHFIQQVQREVGGAREN